MLSLWKLKLIFRVLLVNFEVFNEEGATFEKPQMGGRIVCDGLP